MKPTLLYIHGFASNGNATKAGILKRELAGEYNVLSYTLPLEPFVAIPFIQEKIKEISGPVILIGSSLGGFYAWHISEKLEIPAILINPSTMPWKTLQNMTGANKNQQTGEVFIFEEAWLKQLKELNPSKKNQRLLHFFIANDDELLNHSDIEILFPGAGSIRRYNGQGHGFSGFVGVMGDIREVIGKIC